MKEKMVIFVIGLLLGAIISTGSMYVYSLVHNTNNNTNQGMQMPNGNPPSMNNNGNMPMPNNGVPMSEPYKNPVQTPVLMPGAGPVNPEPIYVASLILCASPPDKVPAALDKVRYSSPTSIKNCNLVFNSFNICSAIISFFLLNESLLI